MSVPRRLRAPEQDGAFVAEPPLAEAGALLAENRRLLTAAGPVILGRSFADLRADARRSVLEAAQSCLRNAGDPLPILPGVAADSCPILMAGHQPELYHPGVWVKNFALQRLAREQGGIPINLIVDNDSAKGSALRVPVFGGAGQAARTHLQSIPFDARVDEAPYEERLVHDEGLFADLPTRAASAFNRWGFEPLLPAFWNDVRKQAERTRLLGERLAGARRAWERRWGCHNLEVPVSAVCQTGPFAWFACHLLTTLPCFHATYNQCVHEYRERYGLRSPNHPVPDLAVEGEWLETPFWAWRAGAKRRGRLLARQNSAHIELRVGDEAWPVLPLRPTASLIGAWQRLEPQGYKVRFRALTNTMFARLFLCDLFLHGIGGGKYDELTDEIIRRHYGIEPPGFMVLSATLRLPLPTYRAAPDDCRQLKRELRDLRYNPQRHFDGVADPEARRWAAEKQAWLERQPTNRAERRERFSVIRELNRRLLPWVANDLDREAHERKECEEEVRANEILRRRDYAFCLYPEGELQSFCRRFLR